MVKMPLAHGFMDFLGHTVEVGIVEKGRQVEWSFSHLSYICTFMARGSIRRHSHYLRSDRAGFQRSPERSTTWECCGRWVSKGFDITYTAHW